MLGLSIFSILTSGTVRRPHAFHVIAAGFVVWSISTLWWTADFEATRVITGTYVQVAVLAWLMWQHARTESRQHALLASYVIGAYVPALDTIRSYLRGDSISGSATRFAATGFNANEVAIILVFGIPIAWYLAMLTRQRLAAVVYACYLPVAVVAVLLTASRGAVVAGATALLLIPWSLHRLSLRARLGMHALDRRDRFFGSHGTPQVVGTRWVDGGGYKRRRFRRARSVVEGCHFGLSRPSDRGGGRGSCFVCASDVSGGARGPRTRRAGAVFGDVRGCLQCNPADARPAAKVFDRDCHHALHRSAATYFDYRKPMWFLLGLTTAQSALGRREESRLMSPERIALARASRAQHSWTPHFGTDSPRR